MKTAGMPTDHLIIEDRATNTGENAIFSYELIKSMKIDTKKILLVTKPYVERRALAAFEAQWSKRSTIFQVSSQGGSIDEYCNNEQKYDDVVNIMVGDFQRIIEYPKRGLQTKQPMTERHIRAFVVLVRAGFTKRLLS